jgi:hypothetical protein
MIGGDPWGTVTEMEELSELNEDEIRRIVLWLKEVETSIGKDGTLKHVTEDLFDLLDPMSKLWEHAKAENVGFDALKSTNFMARGNGGTRRIVIIDPYN